MKKETALVINTVLSEYWKHRLIPHPMKLQKLLYLCHGEYLVQTGEDLISDDFEAWGYGCVVPEVYHVFEHWGYKEIRTLLVEKGKKEAYVLSETSPKYPVIKAAIDKYCRFDDMYLSDLNHEKGGAWWKTKNKGKKIIQREDIIAEFKKINKQING